MHRTKSAGRNRVALAVKVGWCLGAVAMAAPAFAGTPATWNGSVSTDITNAANYTGGAPSLNDVIFPTGSPSLMLTDSFSLQVNSISFDNSNGSYSITGGNLEIAPSSPSLGMTFTHFGLSTFSCNVFLGGAASGAFGQTWNTGSTSLILNGSLLTRYTDNTANNALILANFTPVVENGLIRSSLAPAYLVLGGSGSMILSSTCTVNDNGSTGLTGLSTGSDATGNALIGSLTIESTASTYTGATNWRTGTLVLGASAGISSGSLGNTSGVNLGASSGNEAVTLVTDAGGITVAKNITVTALGTGSQTVTIGGTQTSGTSTYSGTITFNRNLIMSAASGGEVDITHSMFGGTSQNLSITGGGTVKLTASNTFGGSGANVTVSGSSTLLATVDGALGQSNVSVTSSTLTESGGLTNNYINDSRGLSLDATSIANLNYTGTDIIGALTLAGVSEPAGVYGAIGNITVAPANQSALFGTYNSGAGVDVGTVTVTPEPASMFLLGIGGGALVLRRRRIIAIRD